MLMGGAWQVATVAGAMPSGGTGYVKGRQRDRLGPTPIQGGELGTRHEKMHAPKVRITDLLNSY
jgi:hypothetical protein